MSIPANRAQFRCAIAGVEHEFRVLAFEGHEALSRLFDFELELVCTRPDLDLQQLLNRDLVLEIGTSPSRFIHGIIRAASQGATSRRFSHYQVSLAPHLYWLRLRQDVRIFQDLSVPDIVRKLLDEAGIDPTFYRFELTGSYAPRTYCVQYNESTLDFMERLLAEEGICYYFEHHQDRHVWVVADHQQSFRETSPAIAEYRNDAAMVGTPCVQQFQSQWDTALEAVTLTDYNYQKPSHSLLTQAATGVQTENSAYFWPGNYRDLNQGQMLARQRLDAERIQAQQGQGQSTLSQFSAGTVFQLDLHPRPEYNRQHLLLEVSHYGRQPQVLEEYAGSEGSQYHNRFVTVPADQPYRPPLLPKPYAYPQTAVVVGPSSEQVYTDEYGNIQVRFHWDREGQNSCWLRVTQAWAGNFWGSQILPRVGQEVVVDFINGDPDQPIVTGCLHHGLHKPPYPLPEHKSKTLIRSHSLSGQDGHELLLEDKAEQEKIAVHSAGDLELHVTQDSKTAIDRNRHTQVKGNSTQTVKGSQHLIVQGERRTRTGGQHSLDIGQAQHLKAGTAIHLQSGQDLHLKAGIKAALSAGIEVVLKAGASSLVLNPAGVFVNGPVINLTGGGMAGAAVGASPQVPAAAARIGGVKAGSALLQPAPTSNTPLKFSFERLQALKHTLINIALSDQPSQEICQKPDDGPCTFASCRCE